MKSYSKDPTRTITLRNQFIADFQRRFRQLKGWIVNYLVDQNKLQPITSNFEYRYAAEKHQLFMDWLAEQESKGVLQIIRRDVPYRTIPANQPWINTYIWTAYQKGLVKARMEMRAAGYDDIPTFMMTDDFLVSPLFHAPFHSEAIALTFTRTFTDLKGITSAMDSQISRVLARGMAEGYGSERIARDITKKVDSIGIIRARVLARTEVVKAYNDAQLNDYEGMQDIIGEEILVQWWTARDERVRRPRHTSRHAKIYRIADARKLLGEPNCRCTILPYMVSVNGPVSDSQWGPINPA